MTNISIEVKPLVVMVPFWFFYFVPLVFFLLVEVPPGGDLWNEGFEELSILFLALGMPSDSDCIHD